MMQRYAVALFALFLPAALLGAAGESAAAGPEGGRLRLIILFDNVPQADGLKTGWGYACLVQGLEQTVLFDTGSDGEILLSNMETLGVDPASVDVVFLSHLHGDHTRGLQRFLERNSDVDVVMPAGFPESLREQVRATGARVRTVEGPTKIFEGAHSTGQTGDPLVEQALVLESRGGLALITGCAHSGIADIVARTRRRHEREVGLIVGGFHLGGLDAAELDEIVRSLRASGVARVAPSHCTGEDAVAVFRRIWGKGFVEAGCGAVIDF